MADFNFLPDTGAKNNPKVNTIVHQFGDGYSQRQAVGLNPKADQWTLTFNNRSKLEGQQIDDFLNDRMGVESFQFARPTTGVMIKVVCLQGNWTTTVNKGGLYNITAKFDQVFEP